MALLALPPSDGEASIQLSTLSLQDKTVEPAGHFYEKYYLKIKSLRNIKNGESPINEEKENGQEQKDSEKSGDEDEGDNDGEGNFDKADMNKKRKQKRDQAINNYVKKSHYELLGLEDVQSSEKEIKKAFRKLSLIYHPDKYEEGAYNDNAKAKWLSLQEAYECLMDKEKRRIYDSTMEFDDEIPDETLPAGCDFFDIFAPIFKRNAYWHVDQKKLFDFGDKDTPIEKVKKMYLSWDMFKSWRDFTLEDEYDVMQAEDRYEKRWMEKQNQRMKKDLYKKERYRIQKLVRNAQKNDPRILKLEQEMKENEEKKKREKQEKKDAKINELRRIEAEKIEAALKIVDDEASKKQKIIDEKKAKRIHIAKVSQDFKDALKAKLPAKGHQYDRFWADEFMKKIKEEQTIKSTEKLNTIDSPEEALQWIEELIRINTKGAVKKAEEKKEEVTQVKSTSYQTEEWSKDEITLLTKAILKYPVGMSGRQDKIIIFIGKKKSMMQVTSMIHELKTTKLQGPDALKAHIENYVDEKKKAAGGSPLKEQNEAKKNEPKAEAKVVIWSQEEQNVLQASMKKFPASLDKLERWNKISEAVHSTYS